MSGTVITCALGRWPDLNSGFTFRDHIKSKHARISVLQFYASVHAASGDAPTWTRRILNGQVSVNGEVERSTERALKTGDLLAYTRLPWREPPAPCHVELLYEDENMVALSKPSGLQVLPAAMFHDRTLLALLQQHYGAGGRGGRGGAGGARCMGGGRGGEVGGNGEVGRGPAGQQGEGAAEQASATPGLGVGGAAAGGQQGRRSGAAAEPPERSVQVAGGSGGSGGRQLPDAGCGGGSGSGGVGQLSAEAGAEQGERGAGRTPKGRGAAEQLLVPAPVHRLGRGTSGLLLCARTPEARRRLTELMVAKTATAAAAAATAAAAAATEATAADRTGAAVAEAGPAGAAPAAPSGAAPPSSPAGGGGDPPLRKVYRALVQGLVEGEQGRVDVPIGPVPHPGVDGGLFAATPTGKPASSAWRVLERRAVGCGAAGGGGQQLQAGGCGAGAAPQGDETLLEVEIFTGRPHQIRIHTAAMGHPLVGDPLYGPGGVPKAELSAAAALAASREEGAAPGAAGEAEAGLEAAAGAGEWGEGGGAAGRPGDCGYHLHAHSLQLPHPVSGRPLLLVAPPPPRLRTRQEREHAGAAEVQ